MVGKTYRPIRSRRFEGKSCFLDVLFHDTSADPYQTPVSFLSQTYLSGDSISFIKSLCQIYGNLPFKLVRARLDVMLADPDYSRHKQRAFAEVLSGLVRGSKHWPGKDRKEFWEWLTPSVDPSLYVSIWCRLTDPLLLLVCSVLPKIHQAVKPDTLALWAMFFDFNVSSSTVKVLRDTVPLPIINCLFQFYKRDPRRMQPMLDFVLEKAHSCDVTSSSAFESTKSLTWLSCLMRCMTWRFDAWSDSFIGPFFDSLGLSDFAEVSAALPTLELEPQLMLRFLQVRNLIAENLHRFQKIQVCLGISAQ